MPVSNPRLHNIYLNRSHHRVPNLNVVFFGELCRDRNDLRVKIYDEEGTFPLNFQVHSDKVIRD